MARVTRGAPFPPQGPLRVPPPPDHLLAELREQTHHLRWDNRTQSLASLVQR